MKSKITKNLVDRVEPDGKDQFIWDTEIKGFGLKVTPAGSKIYIAQYRVGGRGSPTRRFTLGKHGVLTPDQARKEAKSVLGDVSKGNDPQTSKQTDRHAITLSNLCDDYLMDGCLTKKHSTIITDKGRIIRHIKPLLGNKKVKDINVNDIKKFMRDVAQGKTAREVKTGKHGLARVTGGEGTATRTVGLLGGILSYAVSAGIRLDNPVRGIKRYKDKKNERYLSPKEMFKLGSVLIEAEEKGETSVALNAIRLLGKPALQLLDTIPKTKGSRYVFPSTRGTSYFVGTPKVWLRIRKLAKLDDVRLHDLRHSFASVGAGAGLGLQVVGKLLGHADPKTTARYSHIADDPARSAADRISGVIASSLEGKSNMDKVVKIKKVLDG